MKAIQITISIIICELAGIIGSIFTAKSVKTWYLLLKKPVFNPPSWVFGPVWTTLYAMMGYSAYRIWAKGFARTDVKIALAVFAIQLILNSLWSFIFFGKQDLALALVEIIVMWFFIGVTMILFYKIDKTSAMLLLPYLLWVSFASFLNYSLWRLN
jgi:tryptophan-rich sensory protein